MTRVCIHSVICMFCRDVTVEDIDIADIAVLYACQDCRGDIYDDMCRQANACIYIRLIYIHAFAVECICIYKTDCRVYMYI